MLRLLKVTGTSLVPAYRDGDFVLTSKIPILLRRLHPGDALAFRHEIYGTLIKLVQRVDLDRDEIEVVGLHEHSVDSRRFGPIHRRDVIGKVVWHIPKPG